MIDAPSKVDPRAPRFGQFLTATLMVVGVALVEPMFVYLVAGILTLAAVTGWRLDIYGLIWRGLAGRVIAPTTERESASPHRFAKLLGMTASLVASGLLLGGFTVAGMGVALAVAIVAGLSAVSGICIGCRMYRQVAFFRRINVV